MLILEINKNKFSLYGSPKGSWMDLYFDSIEDATKYADDNDLVIDIVRNNGVDKFQYVAFCPA